MLATHQIVTTVLLSLHMADIEKTDNVEIDNVLIHYKIAVPHIRTYLGTFFYHLTQNVCLFFRVDTYSR